MKTTIRSALVVAVAVGSLAGLFAAAAWAAAGKVSVCHKNDRGVAKAQVVPEGDLAVHLAHGDAVGACAVTATIPQPN